MNYTNESNSKSICPFAECLNLSDSNVKRLLELPRFIFEFNEYLDKIPECLKGETKITSIDKLNVGDIILFVKPTLVEWKIYQTKTRYPYVDPLYEVPYVIGNTIEDLLPTIYLDCKCLTQLELIMLIEYLGRDDTNPKKQSIFGKVIDCERSKGYELYKKGQVISIPQKFLFKSGKRIPVQLFYLDSFHDLVKE